MSRKKINELESGDIILHNYEIYILLRAESLQKAKAYFVCSIPKKDFEINNKYLIKYYYEVYESLFRTNAVLDRVVNIMFKKDEDDFVLFNYKKDKETFRKWYLKSCLQEPELPILKSFKEVYDEYNKNKDYLTRGDNFVCGQIYTTKNKGKYMVYLPERYGDLYFYVLSKEMVSAIRSNDIELLKDLLDMNIKLYGRYNRTMWYADNTVVKLYDTGLNIDYNIIVDYI